MEDIDCCESCVEIVFWFFEFFWVNSDTVDVLESLGDSFWWEDLMVHVEGEQIV